MQNASYVVTAFASMALASVRARLLPGAQSRARAAYFADGGRRTPDAVAVSSVIVNAEPSTVIARVSS